jgi:DNA invertase Pin-like site-specific DNA recombinase
MTAAESQTMPYRAYPYVRHSTKDQKDGDSVRRQREQAEKLAAQHGWLIDTSFPMYDDGRSAFHKDNITKGALGQFMQAVESGRISAGSVLIIENWDRFSRGELSFVVPKFYWLLNKGIKIACSATGRVYDKLNIDTGFDSMEITLMMTLANMESVRKSDMIKKEWAERRKTREPRGKTCPAWVRPKEDGTGYELIAQHAATIRQIHEWAQTGLGAHRITQALRDNPELYPVMGKSRRRRNGEVAAARWTVPYVQLILDTRRTYGIYEPAQRINGKRVYTGELYHDYYPAVITQAQWEDTQNAIAHRLHHRPGRPGASDKNLFTSIVFNAETTHPMSMSSSSRPNGSKSYFLASYSYDTRCNTVPYDDFDDAVTQAIIELKPCDVLPPSANIT